MSIWLRTIPNRLSIWDFGHLDHFVFLFQMQSDLTVIATGISILLQYLNHTLEPNDGDTWTISATRCENVEEILKGCCIILQCCGNTAYLSSVYRNVADHQQFVVPFRTTLVARTEGRHTFTYRYSTSGSEVIGVVTPRMA